MPRSTRFFLRTAVLLVVAGLLGGPAAAESPSDVVTGQVSAGVVSPGTDLRFGGSGFAPRAEVRLTSEGASLGTTRADAAGAFLATVTLSGAPGFRAIAGTGADPDGRTRVATVTVRVAAGAASTTHRPSESTGLALLAGLGIIVLGAGGRLLRQRRKAVGAVACL